MSDNKFKILLVDDEPDILEIISYNLKSNGFEVFTALNGVKALKKAKSILPDLIILDVMMPEMDGIETCEEIRKIHELNDTVITFLTARSEDYSQLAGFDAGADDYINKPIKPKLLVGKVKSLLRRLNKNKVTESKNVINFGDLIIDREEYKITLNKNEILLPRKEFELLYLLASKPGKVFKREVILEKIWGHEVVVGDRTIDVHIRKLREKLGQSRFKTIKGVGYKFKNK
ncbi:MAG: response regulator transcription factor [Flavobacteriaceae bacterium]